MTGPSYTPPHNRQPTPHENGSPSNTAVSTVFHSALNVTNIRNLVPLTLDGVKVLRPSDISEDLWQRFDASVLQWIYGKRGCMPQLTYAAMAPPPSPS
uniref:Uncharacterized protein n=1 Tax=Chenopodium quinoa TaxID=63459 RepID=A0A803M2K3_CHEQI